VLLVRQGFTLASTVTEAVSIVTTFETGYAPEVYIDGAATTFASVSTADPALVGAGTHLIALRSNLNPAPVMASFGIYTSTSQPYRQIHVFR
jgi:hypothetical protein